MSTNTLAEKIVVLTRALASIPHAFGGAIALAYYAEPRATIDIDLNVFVPVADIDDVAAAIEPIGVVMTESVRRVIATDGQGRVDWDGTPLDLFFAYDPFHEAAGAARRTVPFADTVIPILAVEHLIVCKAVFDRPKDWVDIDAVVELGGGIDITEVLRWMGRLVGDDDPRYSRVGAVLTRRRG